MNFKNVICSLSASAFLIIGAMDSQAEIVMLDAPFDKIAAPNSVAEGALESDSLFRVFDEKQGVTIAASLGLAAGTYNSYFIHFDKTSSSSNDFTLDPATNPTITFSDNIVAIFAKDSDLDDSDGVFGSMTTTYVASSVQDLRGAGTINGEGNDNFSDSGDSLASAIGTKVFTLDKLRLVGTGVDQIRIVTAVPEPSSLALFGFAMFGLARRRK